RNMAILAGVGIIGIAFAHWNASQMAKSPLEIFNPNDRCLFLKGEGDMQYLIERQERETNGYSESITLRRALEIFNEEQKCYPHRSEPLSEDEVVAAVSAGQDYGSASAFLAHRSDLLVIAQERRMPRGALFVSVADGIYSDRLLPGDVTIEGQRIYLFL